MNMCWGMGQIFLDRGITNAYPLWEHEITSLKNGTTYHWNVMEKNSIYLILKFFPDMEYLEVLTEGLERVLMVRGGGREVITIYS